MKFTGVSVRIIMPFMELFLHEIINNPGNVIAIRALIYILLANFI